MRAIVAAEIRRRGPGPVIKAFLIVTAAALSLSSPAEGRQLYVDGPYGQIHVRIEGPANGPKLLMLHKMFWSGVQFSRVQGLLAKRGIFSVVVDLPGYGYSDAPPAQPTTEQYAEAMMPVLDALHIKRVVALGVDTGSSVALALAVAHPDRVSRLVIDGAPIFDTATAKRLIDAPHFDRTPRPDGETLKRRWATTRAIVGPTQASDANVQTSVLQFFTAAPNWWWAHDAIFRYDFAAALARTRTPGMLLSFSGGALHAQEASVMKLRPDFKLRPIAVGAFTTPSFDAPDVWAAAVADYVLDQPE